MFVEKNLDHREQGKSGRQTEILVGAVASQISSSQDK